MLRCIISSPVQRPLPIHAGINVIRKGERATVVANSLSSFTSVTGRMGFRLEASFRRVYCVWDGVCLENVLGKSHEQAS